MVFKINNPYASGGKKGAASDKPQNSPAPQVKRSALNERLRQLYVPDPNIPSNGKSRNGDINEERIRADSMRNVVSNRIEQIMDAENMEQLLPDLKLAKEILISSILSPNNLMDVKLVFNCTASDMGELANVAIGEVEDYFSDDYKINGQLHDILERILFTSGSHPIAVIPEAAIDAIINGEERISVESIGVHFDEQDIAYSIGLIAPNDLPAGDGLRSSVEHSGSILRRATQTISFEAERAKRRFGIRDNQIPFNSQLGISDLLVKVTDNPNALKLAMLNSRIRDNAVQSAMENVSATHVDGREDMMRMQSTRRFDSKHIVTLKTLEELKRPSHGHPLVQFYPSESVIPVHVPGSPEKHIGYFIMLDRFGNPVYSGDYKDFFNQLSRSNKLTGNMASSMLNATATATNGPPDASSEINAMEAINRYREVVESLLQGRLHNGVIGPNSQLAFTQEAIRIMFARQCAQQQTQLVYVPASLMTYMALDYNKDGTGRSLLEANKIIGGIRAVILFANSMASIRNSIPRKKVSLELSPNDPDPFKTVEFVLHEVARVSSSQYPVGITNPADITHSLQMAGYEVEVSNHPGFPQTKLAIDDIQSNVVKPDTEFQDSMKDTMLMSMGLVPNTVDLSMEADFATSVVSSNILLAKRALLMQQRFCVQLTDFIKAFITNSSILRDKLKKIFNEMRNTTSPSRKKIEIPKKISDDQLVLYFISHLEVKLPEPDFSRLDMDLQAFQRFTELLEAVLPAFISSDIFSSEILGKLGDSIDITTNVLKAYYQRQYLRKNNILPELFDLIKVEDKDGSMFDLLDMHEQYGENISKSLINFMTKMLLRTTATNKLVDQLQERAEVESSSTSSSDDSGDDSGEGGDGGDGDDGFGDGFGFDDGGDGGGEGKKEPGADETPDDGGSDDKGADDSADADKDK